jgi:hypothetical protein
VPKVTPKANEGLYQRLNYLLGNLRGVVQQQTTVVQDSTRFPQVGATGASGASGSTGYESVNPSGPNTVMISGQLPDNVDGSYAGMVSPHRRYLYGASGAAHRPYFGHQIINDEGAVVFEANQDDQVSPNRFEFSYPGLITAGGTGAAGLSAKYPIHIFQPGYVWLINASLSTVDSSNPVTVGFYINGVQFYTLNIPCAANWIPYNNYNVSDTIIPAASGATGYSVCCVVAGESGEYIPAFSSTPGSYIAEAASGSTIPAVWQTIDHGFCFHKFLLTSIDGASSPAFGVPYLPGNADDYLQVKIESYAGATASDLQAHMRVR